VSWKVRHQGSGQFVDNLTVAQIVEGLRDGLWEPSDEVMGPQDREWIPLEDHPKFAELVEELDLDKPPESDEEERLDMNPLIDVCLVLLVFFILTTSIQLLEKVLDMPRTQTDNPEGVRQVTQEQVESFMIRVEARREGNRPVIRVEGQEVPAERLEMTLSRFVKDTRKTELLLDASGVDYGTVVKIIDAAGGARISKIHFLARPAPQG